MIKNLVSISLLASLVLLSTGCGGGGSSDNSSSSSSSSSSGGASVVDTTPPVITNQITYSVEEDTNRTIHLTANEDVNFSMVPTPYFTLTNTDLTFSAPEFNRSAEAVNEYTATVIATDTAGNDANKTFIFSVTKKIANAAVTVVPTGDKNITNNGDGTYSYNGLTWDVSGVQTGQDITSAQNMCNAPKRLPYANEILDLLDYDRASTATHVTLLDDDFNETAIYDISEFWAKPQNGQNLFVNVRHGGVSYENNESAVYAVICVEGSEPVSHTLTDEGNNVVLDEMTQLEWKKMPESERYVMDDNLLTSYCQDPWKFPNINQLRTLIDPVTGKVDGLLMPDFDARPTSIWSATKFFDRNSTLERNFIVKTSAVPFIVNVDEVNSKNYVTCVKAK